MPAVIYTTAQQVVDAIFEIAARTVRQYDPAAIVSYSGATLDISNSTLAANGQMLYLIIVSDVFDESGFPTLSGVPTLSSATSITIPLASVLMNVPATHVYLRTDAGPGHNIESPGLAGQADASPYTDMRHSDILGSVALTRGENTFTWRAFIKDERCFDAQHALQSLTLRLNDHRNAPLSDDVHFSCTLGVKVFIQHDIRRLGYGPTPSPVDPKDEKILLSLR
jgi:hypothetical protein